MPANISMDKGKASPTSSYRLSWLLYIYFVAFHFTVYSSKLFSENCSIVLGSHTCAFIEYNKIRKGYR